MSPSASDTSEFEASSEDNSSDEDGDGDRRSHGKGKVKTVKGRATSTPASMIDDALSDSNIQRKIGSKRKSSKSHYDSALRSARKRVHTNEYRELLNEQIRGTSTQISSDDHDSLWSSQIGVTRWSSSEKEAFFKALSRLGRDDLPGIASAIGSKSESEVYVYSRLLRQGVADKHLYEPRRQLLGPMELPAAIEIGQECCDMLDRAAESLELEQRRYEEEMEATRWGDDRWLLTPRVADWVAEKLEGGEEDLEDIEVILPPAVLLKLEGWLELSSRVFMNPAPPQEDHNWRNIADQGEMPSIRCTAFEDFHTLAVGFTKRLIQTTLFYAMSRLRSTDSRFFKPTPHVKPVDVHTACRVLGVKLNSDEFWIGAARRCGLDVYQRMPTSGVQAEKATRLDYGDVERQLIDLIRGSNSSRTATSSLSRRGDEDEDEDGRLADAAGEESDSSSTPSSPSSSMSSQSSSDKLISDLPLGSHHIPVDTSDEEDVKNFHNRPGRPDIVPPSRHALEQAQDEYAEAIDRKASREEEQRLWSILHLQPRLHSIPPEVVVVPEEKPRQERKRAEELVDWRERLEYKAEWEMMPRGSVSEKASRGSKSRADRRSFKPKPDDSLKLSKGLPNDEHDDEDPVEVEEAAASDVSMEDASGGSDQHDTTRHGGQSDNDSASSSSPLGWVYRAAVGAMDKVVPPPPAGRPTRDAARPVRTRSMPSSTGLVSTGSSVITEDEDEEEEEEYEEEDKVESDDDDDDDDSDNDDEDDKPSDSRHAEPAEGAEVQYEEDDDNDDDDDEDDEPSDSSSEEPDEGAQRREGTLQADKGEITDVYDDYGDN